MRELNRAGDAERGEAGEILRREQLRMLDPVAQPERLPDRPRLLERVERLPVRAVADRVHRDGKPGRRACADDLGELLAARDPNARAVEHQRRLRAERPVHECLQVADPQQRAPEARRDPERRERADLIGRNRLPHAQRQRARPLEALPQPERAEPAVLVVHRGHATRRGELQPGPHRVDVDVVGDDEVAFLEPPCRLLPQDSRRLALARPARPRRPRPRDRRRPARAPPS